MESGEVTFGPFRLDFGRRELRRGDAAVRLGGRAIGILCELVAAKGQLVTKDMLIDRVWAGVIVEDNAIQVHVSALRKALDTGDDTPDYVMTVPGRGYRFIGLDPPAVAAREVDGAVQPLLPDKPSIAVLPFDNMSDDVEQEYFADGLVEDIITALSRLKWFFVIARNSSFTYKGQAVDVRRVGRELGVQYVLEGSVRRSGGRIRITGQLVDTLAGNHIWADRFDGDLADIFDLQDRITASVAGAVEPRLRQAEIERVQSKPTENLTAYDHYLRALAQFHKLTSESVADALTWLDRAVAVDPDYSSAYGLAAACRQARITQGWTDGEEERTQAVCMAKLAVETGRDDPLALAWAGRVMSSIGREHAAGLAHIERALALNPNSALALQSGGWVSWHIGRHQECIDYNAKAMLLSPLDPLTYRCHVGMAWSYFFTGHFDAAIASADKAFREQPNFTPALRVKIAAAAMADRVRDMQDALSQLRAVQRDISISALMKLHPSRPQAQRNAYEAALRKAGLT
jgi:TolB-like protein/Tfp pilus assembly protein PilF